MDYAHRTDNAFAEIRLHAYVTSDVGFQPRLAHDGSLSRNSKSDRISNASSKKASFDNRLLDLVPLCSV